MNLIGQSPEIIAFEQETRFREALSRSSSRRKKAPKKPDASASDVRMAKMLSTPIGVPKKMSEAELYDQNKRKPADFLESVSTGRTVIVPAD